MLLLLKSNTAGALAASVGITLTVAATLTVTPASGAALAASVPVTITTVAALNATSSSFTASVPITLTAVANLTIRPPAALLSAVAVRFTIAANLTTAPAAAGNLTAATATVMTLPWSSTQDVNVGGLTKTVWYKVTPTEDGELGLFGFGDLVTYQPTVATFTPDGVTPSDLLSPSTNKRIQLPVTAGQTYYFRFSSSTGNVTPAVLLLTAELFTPQTAPAGSILVNDDTGGFPAAILSASNGDALRFVQPFSAGEAGSILPNGISCFEDDDLNHDGSGVRGVVLYDARLTQIATVTRAAMGLTLGSLSICNDDVDTFYVGQAGNGLTVAKVVTVSSAGVVGGTSWTLSSAGLIAIGVSPDETILYLIGQGSSLSAAVARWDLVNNVPLSDLVAGVVGYTPFKDLLVFPDGTLLVGYRSAGDGFLRHYSAAGAILLQIAEGTTLRSDDRLAFALDNPVSFWLWRHAGPLAAATGISTFDNIALADGSLLSTRDAVQFENGVYAADATATPLDTFGHSFSCPFLILRGTPACTLVVQKTTNTADPDAEFTFTVSGGLSPATFTLKHGQSRTFADITPGTYAVAETILPTGWTLGSAVVSNGDAVSAITIDDGETVTALFSNVAAEHVCPPATERVACWSGFTGAELQIWRVAE